MVLPLQVFIANRQFLFTKYVKDDVGLAGDVRELAIPTSQFLLCCFNRVATQFQATWRLLSISYDQFIRTTAEPHKLAVRELIDRIFERNPDDFYEQTYRGLYCVGCEAFKTPADIGEGRCVIHPTRELEEVEERNWFFRLTRYQAWVEEFHRTHPTFVQPEIRRNEILGLFRQGLEDVSVSRSGFSWGVPFPRPTSDGEPQTTYVRFDALPNYWTASRFRGSRATWPALRS